MTPVEGARGLSRTALVAGGVTALLGVIDLLSLWSSPGTAAIWVIPSTLIGAALAAAGVAAAEYRARRLPSRLVLATAAVSLCVPILTAAGWRRPASVTLVAAGMLVLPPTLMTVVRISRARGAQVVLLCAAMTAGLVGTVAAAAQSTTEVVVAGLVVAVVVFCCGWLQFELTSGEQRRQLLWLVVGAGSAVPAVSLYLVAAGNLPGSKPVVALVASLLAIPLPLGVAFALISPERYDVRRLISRTVLVVVMLTMTIALFTTVAATWQQVSGREPSVGLLGVLVALIAAGFHPVLVQLRSTVDELLFGGRADPMETLTQLGDHLRSDTAPREWLETLRSTLAVPSLSVRRDGELLSSAGPAPVGLTASVELWAGTVQVGELVVGLPREQRQLPPTTRAVLDLVAAPLAQALRAVSLTEQLQASRRLVVGALEEERRRVRRDLHDGLGPQLAGIAYSADAVANLLPTDQAQAEDILHELRADVGEAIAEIRRIVYGLRPKALDELGLLAAIAQRVSRLGTADGRPLTVRTSSTALPLLPAAVEVVAYRVAVEAVTNVARHAGVAEVELSLRVDGDELEVLVSDGGAGPVDWAEGVGITSMRERVAQIGGLLEVGSGPYGGRVRARLPLGDPPTAERP